MQLIHPYGRASGTFSATLHPACGGDGRGCRQPQARVLGIPGHLTGDAERIEPPTDAERARVGTDSGREQRETQAGRISGFRDRLASG
jgi:hypothetical protein